MATRKKAKRKRKVCDALRNKYPLLLNGDLTEREFKAIAGHVPRCRACQGELCNWQLLIHCYRKFGKPEISRTTVAPEEVGGFVISREAAAALERDPATEMTISIEVNGRYLSYRGKMGTC